MESITKIYLLSKYKDMDSAYWGLGLSANGQIYFSLCTHQPGKSAIFFEFDPISKSVKKLFALDEHIKSSKTSLSQGKIHTPIFEGNKGLLYFGTHFAYPHGEPQNVIYDGGHIVAYDYKNNDVIDLGIPLPHEGILTLILDKKRMLLYMLTAPSFFFIAYDIINKRFQNFGRVTKNSSVCRTLTIDDLGNVYGSFEKNRLFTFNQANFRLEYISIRLPSTKEKIKEWKDKTRGGVNSIGRNMWRSALFNDQTKQIYGIHSGTSKLFAFNTKRKTIKELNFMGADVDKNTPEMIFPTLSLAQYKNILYYVPASGFFDYSRSKGIMGYSHFVSYDPFTYKRIDHGEITDEHGRKVFGVAGSIMDNSGRFFLLGAVEVKKNEEYTKQNIIQGKPFHLGLIEIDVNKFI